MSHKVSGGLRRRGQRLHRELVHLGRVIVVHVEPAAHDDVDAGETRDVVETFRPPAEVRRCDVDDGSPPDLGEAPELERGVLDGVQQEVLLMASPYRAS